MNTKEQINTVIDAMTNFQIWVQEQPPVETNVEATPEKIKEVFQSAIKSVELPITEDELFRVARLVWGVMTFPVPDMKQLQRDIEEESRRKRKERIENTPFAPNLNGEYVLFKMLYGEEAFQEYMKGNLCMEDLKELRKGGA